MRITGVILAGGRGRRMGGVDKGLVELHGKPMVSHVIGRLEPQVAELFINANRETARYEALGLTVIEDDVPGFAGPLAGLHKAMKLASHPYVLAVPCDSPILPAKLAQRFINAMIERDADIVIAKAGAQVHPVFCLCRTSLLPSLESYLQSGGRKVEDWQRKHDLVEVVFDDQSDAFYNVNTSEELAHLAAVVTH